MSPFGREIYSRQILVPMLRGRSRAQTSTDSPVRGRRIDLHRLRKTYGTMLAVAGVSPRVAMELMRHCDMKLTMGVYTDVAQLPMIAEAARLPSSSLPNISVEGISPPAKNEQGSQGASQRGAQTGVAAGPGVSSPDATDQNSALCNPLEIDALGHKKTPCDITGRFLKMERAKRLELSTSSLARKCSTH